MLTDDSRSSEEEDILLTLNLQHFIVLLRYHIDVVAPADDELRNLLQDVRWRPRHRVTDDAVESGLHRTGRNFEWLEEIGPNSNRNDDRHEDDFHVLSPMRFPSDRR